MKFSVLHYCCPHLQEKTICDRVLFGIRLRFSSCIFTHGDYYLGESINHTGNLLVRMEDIKSCYRLFDSLPLLHVNQNERQEEIIMISKRDRR
jgi:hypothetical protein